MKKGSQFIALVALCATASLALMSLFLWLGTAHADTPPTLSLTPSSGGPLTKTTDSLVATYTSPTGCDQGKCYIVSFSASDGSLGACFGTLYGAYSGTSYSEELNYSLNPTGGAECGFGLGYTNPSSDITSTQVFVLAAMPLTPDSTTIDQLTAACSSSNPLSTLTGCEAFLNANNIPYTTATYTVLPTLSLVPSSGPPLTQSTDSLKAVYTSPVGCSAANPCQVDSYYAADGRSAACDGNVYGASPSELNGDINPLSLGNGPCDFDSIGDNPPAQVTSSQIFLFYVPTAANYGGSQAACNDYRATLTGCETYLNANSIPYAAATYTVLTPAQLINALISVVESMNLAQGIQNSLDQKLQNASDALTAANASQRADAVNKLQAFISATQAQSGNKLTVDQANQLIAAANSIIAELQ